MRFIDTPMPIECRAGQVVLTDDEIDALVKGTIVAASGENKRVFASVANRVIQEDFCAPNCPLLDDGRRCCLTLPPHPDATPGEPTPRSIMLIDDPHYCIIQ